MFDHINATDVAAHFAALVRDYVGPAQFELIRLRNASGLLPDGCCASHDFCDSNVFLERALRYAAPAFAARYDAAETDLEHESLMDDMAPVWNRVHAIATQQYLS